MFGLGVQVVQMGGNEVSLLDCPCRGKKGFCLCGHLISWIRSDLKPLRINSAWSKIEERVVLVFFWEFNVTVVKSKHLSLERVLEVRAEVMGVFMAYRWRTRLLMIIFFYQCSGTPAVLKRGF